MCTSGKRKRSRTVAGLHYQVKWLTEEVNPSQGAKKGYPESWEEKEGQELPGK